MTTLGTITSKPHSIFIAVQCPKDWPCLWLPGRVSLLYQAEFPIHVMSSIHSDHDHDHDHDPDRGTEAKVHKKIGTRMWSHFKENVPMLPSDQRTCSPIWCDGRWVIYSRKEKFTSEIPRVGKSKDFGRKAFSESRNCHLVWGISLKAGRIVVWLSADGI